MAKLKPSLRSTDTYTEMNFLRLHTAGEKQSDPLVTLEHFSYSAENVDKPGWQCLTIVDAEKMSHADAVFIARSYAAENGIPVIYESHAE
jgi:predicted metal-dependent TIM-barrel fold hydrolase